METIAPRDMKKYIGNPEFQIMDLRTEEEYRKGHYPGAIYMEETVLYSNLEKWRDYVLILYCERGGKSMSVARELEKEGIRTASVVGGYQAMMQFEKNC